ncbi:MAG: ribosome maturation factor RimP [Gemmatimonadetes bacterium]|nr:ribosome maturation factor RimP [Gemmatimonadota bacterium]
MKDRPIADTEFEAKVATLGYEVVELEWAGTARHPILRLRVDLPDSSPGHGVTIGDCERVSRALEPWLDAHPAMPEPYVLEVSSPGVERPLVKRHDWIRFAGREVAIRGHRPLAGRGPLLEGELVGIRGEEGEERVRLRLADGTELEIAHREIARAHLIWRWE